MSESPSSRNDRRRGQTRRKLIEAAKHLFAERNPDVVPIGDITERADVGFGSFYNHFQSKEEIVEAIIKESAVEWADFIDRAIANLDDKAEVIAAAILCTHRRVVRDPVWGPLIIRMTFFGSRSFTPVGDRLHRDVADGIKAGRFAVAHVDTTLMAITGALMMVNSATVAHHLKPRDAADIGELVLRLLGIAADEATRIVRSEPVLAAIARAEHIDPAHIKS